MSRFAIIAPFYNEARSMRQFLQLLDGALGPLPHAFNVVLVDDGSTDGSLDVCRRYRFASANVEYHVLSLDFNAGHQAAIYQGLLFADTTDAEHFIVMDADGEDDPQAIAMFCQNTAHDVVFAARKKRRENLLFRLFYNVYRLLFFMVTGVNMNVGNYSMINRTMLGRVLKTPFLHYSACLSRLTTDSHKVKFDRLDRLDGRSKMNATKLILHGLFSMAEYSEKLTLFFLKIFVVLFVCLNLSILYVLYEKLFTDKAILGWASTIILLLSNLSLLCLGFFIISLILLYIMNKGKFEITNRVYTQKKLI